MFYFLRGVNIQTINHNMYMYILFVIIGVYDPEHIGLRSQSFNKVYLFQVWDPWSELCRDVYCAADDVVYRCKSDKNNVTK